MELNYEMYGVAIAGLILIYTMFRGFRKDIRSQFSEVKVELKDIKSDLTDIRERIAFLEAANIYTMPIEPSEPNPRSQAAREVWKRRRQKKLEVQNEQKD